MNPTKRLATEIDNIKTDLHEQMDQNHLMLLESVDWLIQDALKPATWVANYRKWTGGGKETAKKLITRMTSNWILGIFLWKTRREAIGFLDGMVFWDEVTGGKGLDCLYVKKIGWAGLVFMVSCDKMTIRNTRLGVTLTIDRFDPAETVVRLIGPAHLIKSLLK